MENTIYNTTISSGIKGVKTAHKVGMFPLIPIYNDIGIIFDDHPFALAVMTKSIPYEKEQQVIAGIAEIVYRHHKNKYVLPVIVPRYDIPSFRMLYG